VLVQFGDDGALELNFLALGLMRAVEAAELGPVIDMIPSYNTLLLEYEPDAITYPDLVRELRSLYETLGALDDLELESRLAYLPVCYLDPWTKFAIEDYCEKITPREFDPDFVARINGLEDRHQLVRVHSGTEHWVASVASLPGLPLLRALDPRCLITSPKYNPPRTWTPQGTVGMGGSASAIYPVATPGGYQLFGRTPIPIWDTKKRFDVFGGEIVLFRPGDRIKFVPVTLEEYELADARINEGTYVYNMVDYQKFSVRNYKNWVATVDKSERF